MTLSRKSALRAVLLLLLGLVVTAMVVPYAALEVLLRRFAWLGGSVDLVDTVAPGLEASHLLAFAVLGFIARFGWPRGRPRNVALAILVVSGLVEFVQLWVPGREASLAHAVLECLGGWAGFAIAWLLTYAWGTDSLPRQFQPSTHWTGDSSDR
jgi:hypothetical protein